MENKEKEELKNLVANEFVKHWTMKLEIENKLFPLYALRKEEEHLRYWIIAILIFVLMFVSFILGISVSELIG